MTAPRRPAARLAGALALTFALASCTGGSDPAPDATGGTTAPSPESRAEVGPVEALQIELIGDVDDDAWERVEHERLEAAIAVCMQAAGFEYTPEPFEPYEMEDEADSIEYARELGYGIATVDDESEDEEEYEPTANDLYTAELSDDELDAYWLAYEGEYLDEDDFELDEEDFGEDGEIDLGDLEIGDDGEIDLGDLEELGDDFDAEDLESSGCIGEAQQSLLDEPLPYDFPEHQDVLAALDEMYSVILDADTILEAEDAWAVCMEEKGYPDLVTSEDAYNLVFDAYEAAWDDVPEDVEDIPEEKIAPVRDLEITIATTDFECRESSGLTTATRDAQFTAEETFIETHREALTAFFVDMGAALKA